MQSKSSAASAPPNIALVKYWGKRDGNANLPAADSVSVCLDGPRTRVTVAAADVDSVMWNNERLPNHLLPPYLRILDELRSPAQKMQVGVTTTVPVAAGLAGSAAVMAALALAASDYFEASLDGHALSALARRGSGSAARSIPAGFAYWHRGSLADGSDSFATSIAGPDHWPELRLVALFLDRERKLVSSTTGMQRTAATSPLYRGWVEACNVAAPKMRDYILARDFAALSGATREQALHMHATCLTAQPPILYLSRRALALLQELERALPRACWCVTFDAGTNPIFLTLADHLPLLLSALDQGAPGVERLIASPGNGAELEAGDP